MDCIFCRIVKREIPADIIFEDDKILCFKDLNPQAPVHALIIPKIHVASLDEVDASPEQRDILGHLILKIHEIAAMLELANGYRLVCNCGEDGLQTVGHLHFHVLGGRRMGWPPG
jgi:histidine triad (HIT) family protein